MNKQNDIEKSLSEISLGEFDQDLCARLESAMNNCIDHQKLTHVEGQLASLTPSSLDNSTLSEMMTEMENVDIEKQLQQLIPSTCSSDLLLRLESAMDSAGNTIELPKISRTKPVSKFRYLSVVAAATAAVIMFAITLNIGGRDQGVQLITEIDSVKENLSTPYQLGMSKDVTTISNIVNTSNEGIVIKDEVPHQAVKVFYEKTIYTRDAKGQPIELKIPLEETVFFPTESY